MNIEVVVGGPDFYVTATHAHWLRFRGECRHMCGADAFWSTLTLAEVKTAQLLEVTSIRRPMLGALSWIPVHIQALGLVVDNAQQACQGRRGRIYRRQRA